MKAFLPFVIIGICVAMYFMYISPIIKNDISTQKQELAQYNAVLEKVEDLKVQREAALKAYQDIPESDKEKLTKIIPEKFSGVLFLKDISAIVAHQGMTLEGYTVNTSQTAEHEAVDVGTPKAKTITISFKVSGKYAQIISFLKDIETNMQLLDITDLNITPSTDPKTQEVKLGAAITLNTYSLN
jgi:Tfp pilus assembly protein PilO